MITRKIFSDLRSICFGDSRFGVLDVEVAFLDRDEFDQDDKHQDVPEPVHSSIGQITVKLLRLLLGRISILLVRLASDFANQQWYFKPPELLPAWWNYSRTSPPALHPTSWLDGLRGVAALFVFFHHTSQVWLRGLRPGWGSSPDAYHIMQLPVLRIIFSGGAMVSIFFVISGYVLSTKPLRLAREGRHEELLSNLASSTFRRGPRLFIPCIVSTFITAILAMTGAFVNEGVARHYPRAGTLWEQLGLWIHETLWLINPFSGGTGFEENLWTIPVEFQGSLLIFLCALGFCKTRGAVRLGSLVCFMAYWLWFGYWATVLFLGGMLLADIGHCRRQSASGTESDRPSGWKSKIILWLLVLIAVFLLSMPEYDEAVTESYGYATLAISLTPASWANHFGPGRWWPCLSSIMLVALIDHAAVQCSQQRKLALLIPLLLLLVCAYSGFHETTLESDDETSSINPTPALGDAISDGKYTSIFSRHDIVNVSSRLGHLTLVKRAPPRGYNSLICAGDKYLTAVKAAFEGTTPSKQLDPKELLNNGWTRTTTATENNYAGVEARWKAAFEGLFGQSRGYPPRSEIKPVSLNQDKAYTTVLEKHIDVPTQAYSVGLYYPSRSLMLSTSSYSVPMRIQEMHQGITKEDRTKLLPTISTLSDLMWLAWNTVSTTPSNLRYLARDKIYNEETMAIMEYLFVRDKNGETRNVPWPGLEYRGESDEGKALLATPNGRATAWLLIDHAQEMKRKGEIGRRELRVHIFSFLGDFCMLWDLEPQTPRQRVRDEFK
ncbi:MAG: hypothetical protein Q9210_005093 [Variospora velana]